MAKISTDTTQAIRLLKEGKLVALPTETVYGLAGKATDGAVVQKIFEAKDRPHYDPLILHFHSLDRLAEYCGELPSVLNDLYDRFCPGPISFLVKKSNKVLDAITAGSDKVAVRFPSHPLFRAVLKELDFPLAAPSANPFGYISPTSAAHVADQLGNKIGLIIDGGASKVGVESTIVDLTTQPIKILRQGAITAHDIAAVTSALPSINDLSTSNPKAPGMLASHYAPRKKVSTKPIEVLLKSYAKDQVMSIRFMSYTDLLDPENQMILSSTGDINEAAYHFFDYMRKADKRSISVIHIDCIPLEGIGAAINDKIKRASA